MVEAGQVGGDAAGVDEQAIGGLVEVSEGPGLPGQAAEHDVIGVGWRQAPGAVDVGVVAVGDRPVRPGSAGIKGIVVQLPEIRAVAVVEGHKT